VEVALSDLVTDPIEMHVYGLGALLFDGVVDNPGCGAVVIDNEEGRLSRMAKLLKTNAKGAGGFAVVEEGGKLGFCDTRSNITETLIFWMVGIS
jgi:hypothetical protein